MRCHDDAHAFSVEFGTREGHYHAWWHELELAIHGVSAAPRSVHLGTTEIASTYDAASQTLRIRIPDQAVASRLTVDTPAARASAVGAALPASSSHTNIARNASPAPTVSATVVGNEPCAYH